MEPLLFLCHRIPFPPNKGDKVRSYNLLKHLAARYDVYLGTFVDDPADRQHEQAVRDLCADAFIADLDPRRARVRSLRGFATGEALTLPYYFDASLGRWIAAVLTGRSISRAVVFSSAMAQYVLDRPNLTIVTDLVDVDSAKWASYALERGWPLSAVYAREGERLLAFERNAVAHSAASLLVTEAEVELFVAHAPECRGRVFAVPNGVDSNYFAPSAQRASPFSPDERPVVFTGAMDYWPNADAACWFATEVFPRVLSARPSARFYIVGMNPTPAVRALTRSDGVVVTGRVDDVRPYIQHAAVVVAPLRVARGVQNKVLEAMAMEKAVVVSQACASGVTAVPGEECEVAADAESFTRSVVNLMDSPRARSMGVAARRRVLRDYNWSNNLGQIDTLLSAAIAARSRSDVAGPPATTMPTREALLR